MEQYKETLANASEVVIGKAYNNFGILELQSQSEILAQFQQKESDTMHSMLVDDAIDNIQCSLPDEITRVTTIQKDQMVKISMLRQELKKLQEHKQKACEQSQKAKDELDRVLQQNYLSQEETAKMTNRCIQLKDDILVLVKKIGAKQHSLSAVSMEHSVIKTKLKKYMQKLEDHTASITSKNTVQTEISQVEQRITKLQNSYKEIIEKDHEKQKQIQSGFAERDLKEKLEEIDCQMRMAKEETINLQKKADILRVKHYQMKQAISVLQKRNKAQLIRLKKLVKEQQIRHHQWSEQNNQLQQNIESLTAKLNQE